jgi:nitroimidazol reductase NimA-like FMN-containing flavoprotein (pyridoxamine 5'-phosphate oxidase superfamily)
MSSSEIDQYLGGQRTCRIATVNRDGSPHVSALWFVWDESAIWLFSLIRSQRWANVVRNPDVAVLIDDGEQYNQLRGVQLVGRAAAVGDIPRTNATVVELLRPETMFGDKYGSGNFTPDGRHAWLRIEPREVKSWNFSKIQSV